MGCLAPCLFLRYPGYIADCIGFDSYYNYSLNIIMILSFISQCMFSTRVLTNMFVFNYFHHKCVLIIFFIFLTSMFSTYGENINVLTQALIFIPLGYEVLKARIWGDVFALEKWRY